MILSDSEKRRVHNKIEVFRVLQDISGIPFLVLISLWGAFDNFRLNPLHKDKGFYGLPPAMDESEMVALLYSFKRLTIDEVKQLMKKGSKNLVCGTLLMAAKLKSQASRAIYPEQDEKLLLKELKAYKPEAGAYYEALRELFKETL